ncbi:MAG: preprotein translocase subunit SecG [Bacteroidales bacterium]|nr:preprotein translocase subunit SecG [Bacteroidales bacterium]MDD4001886.1 preprotein translocase subunit SecG [Bacteroidales bacterium]MDD4529004.1 preprotein translocase subunit SecG [Bacteroidales bacterium]MDD4829658.1 preprotein translocase subunit SecG [Bacteroidales bacterium]
MFVVISVLILIVCLFLGLIVLIQNSKGGGLAANFQSQSQIMGVRKTADFLEQASWGLAVGLLVLCFAATAFMPGKNMGDNKGTELNPTKVNTNMPAPQKAPTQAPQPIQQ